MADIELVIKIPEEVKQAFDCAESNDLKGCYYDHGGVIGNAIKNGTPLPKHHGRLIDQEVFLKKLDEHWSQRKGLCYMDIETIACLMTPTIIPATKEEVK